MFKNGTPSSRHEVESQHELVTSVLSGKIKCYCSTCHFTVFFKNLVRIFFKFNQGKTTVNLDTADGNKIREMKKVILKNI